MRWWWSRTKPKAPGIAVERIERLEVAHFKEGDTLFVQPPVMLSSDQEDELERRLQAVFSPDVLVVVIDPGTELFILRKENRRLL